MSRQKAFQTCIEMMTQRGYEILDNDEESFRLICLKPNGEQMIVLYNDHPKLNTENFQEILLIMKEMDILHCLVVYENNITPHTKKIIDKSTEITIELFLIEDLQYNITKHYLQPIFEKLPDKEAEEFKKKYGLKFPVLKKGNPIASFYDYQKGDVIRIKRKDGFITYRIVKA